MWANGGVPLRTDRRLDTVEAVQDGIRQCETRGVERVDQNGVDSQAGLGQGGPEQGQPGVKWGKGLGRPMDTERATPTLLKRGPLRGASGRRTARHGQTQVIRAQVVNLVLPSARTIARASACVAHAEQAVGGWKVMATDGLPARRARLNRTVGRVGGLTDRDIAPLVRQVVQTLRRRFAERVALKSMGVDSVGGLTPAPTGILEGTTPRFFLGIHADDR